MLQCLVTAFQYFSEEVEVQGHLVDSLILTKILDRIMELGGDFKIKEFRMGRKKSEHSYAKLLVKGNTTQHLDQMLRELYRLGAVQTSPIEVKLVSAPADMILPENFYSTTNHPTWIYVDGEWIEVDYPIMDKVIVVDKKDKTALCKSIREIKKGDFVVVGEKGIKVKPPERPRKSLGIFEFMGSKVSSEKPSASLIHQIAENLYVAKSKGEKIIAVVGPAVIHTGASEALAEMIRLGYIHGLLSGNALAVHDIENALYKTSLGVNLEDGSSSIGSHRNHISAINEVYKVGTLEDMVKKKILKKGIIYECICAKIPLILAGSIRDDGPLPNVITDSVVAQKRYREVLKKTDFVLLFASMLHSIAVGNLLPSTVRTICVDINPSVALKLSDRGTSQAVSIVSDIGVFLPLLVDKLKERARDYPNQPQKKMGTLI